MGSLRCSCLLSCFWVVGVFLLLPIIFVLFVIFLVLVCCFWGFVLVGVLRLLHKVKTTFTT